MRLPRTDAAAVGVVRRLLDAALAEIEANHRCSCSRFVLTA